MSQTFNEQKPIYQKSTGKFRSIDYIFKNRNKSNGIYNKPNDYDYEGILDLRSKRGKTYNRGLKTKEQVNQILANDLDLDIETNFFVPKDSTIQYDDVSDRFVSAEDIDMSFELYQEQTIQNIIESPEFRSSGHGVYYNWLKQYWGQRIRVLIKATETDQRRIGEDHIIGVYEGEILADVVIDLTGTKSQIDSEYRKIYQGFTINNDSYIDFYAWDQHFNVEYIVLDEITVDTGIIPQRFADNESKICLLEPIKRWIQNKISSSKAEKTKKNYTTKLNKINNYISMYPDGVHQDNIQELVNDLKYNITIYDCMDQEYLVYTNDKARHTFKYINTKINHVDEAKVFRSDNPSTADQEAINDYAKQCIENDVPMLFIRNKNNYSMIKTADAYIQRESDVDKIKQEFESETGLDRLKVDFVKYSDLRALVTESMMNASCVQLRNFDNDQEYYHYDHRKSYSQFKSCHLYSGFFKPTDMRRVPSDINKSKFLDRHTGIMYIKNVDISQCDENVKLILTSLSLYDHEGAYTSPDLKYMIELGIEFDIVFGTWGPTIDFEFTDELLEKDPASGVPLYSLITGKWCRVTTSSNFDMNGSAEFAGHLQALGYDVSRWSLNDDGITRVTIPKQTSYGLAHVGSFVRSYSRIQVIKQMLEFKHEHIIRVQVDGIYVTEQQEESKIHKNFRTEYKQIPSNMPSSKWCPEHGVIGWDEYSIQQMPEYREHHRIELNVGAGGSGKTHFNLMDSGFIDVCFIGPSQRLVASKRESYADSVQYTVSQLLFGDNCRAIRPHTDFGVIIVDEATMLDSDQMMRYINTFKTSKIIFCGDFDTKGKKMQLPAQNEGDYNDTLDLRIFDNIRHFNTQYRTTDDVLKTKLNVLRQAISAGATNEEMKQLMFEQFSDSIVDVQTAIDEHEDGDYVICGTNGLTDVYNNELRDKHSTSGTTKYIVNKNGTKHPVTKDMLYNGTIIDLPNDVKVSYGSNTGQKKSMSLGYAFTCHKVQGETIQSNKMFLDAQRLWCIQMAYTALSRVRQIDQIRIINHGHF